MKPPQAIAALGKRNAFFHRRANPHRIAGAKDTATEVEAHYVYASNVYQKAQVFGQSVRMPMAGRTLLEQFRQFPWGHILCLFSWMVEVSQRLRRAIGNEFF